MDETIVKELMVPINEYAVINEAATLFEAFVALKDAQEKVPAGRQPHRAVLVVDKKGNVVGKIGHLAFLKALEPKYNELGNLHAISEAGINPEVLNSIMEDFQFWKGECESILRRTKKIYVKNVMHPVTQNIDEYSTLREALHKIIIYQSLSVLVTRGKKVLGILRLSDLFDLIAKRIVNLK